MDPSTLEVSPGLAGVEAGHEAVLSAADELYGVLLERGLAGPGSSTDLPGTKGWEQYLTVIVGGGGAIGGLVAAFKAWLDRDQRRSLTLRKRVNGRTVAEYRIAGDAVSDETIRAALRQLAEHGDPVDREPSGR